MLDIKVCTEAKCAVKISELEGDYLSESSSVTAKNRFKYSDTVSIDVLLLNKSTDYEILTPVFTVRDTEVKPVQLPVSFDGWFTICHIVLPSLKWFNSVKNGGSALELYDTVYYSDGNAVFKYINGTSTLVTLDEIINRNPEGTTLTIVKKDYVSVCFLRKCYISLCQLLFNSNILTDCNSTSKNDCELVFQRDLVWMALNVILYLTELNQLAEAERIIEQLGRGCNGLCKQNSLLQSKSGCGCS